MTRSCGFELVALSSESQKQAKLTALSAKHSGSSSLLNEKRKGKQRSTEAFPVDTNTCTQQRYHLATNL